MTATTMITGYRPGLIGRITELHAEYYARHWNFGTFFEARVATELSDFVRQYDPQQDLICSLDMDGRIEGSITIDGSSDPGSHAHLRWFIVSERLQGQGAGKRLLQQAMDFCRSRQYEHVYLDTFKGLDSAHHLYEKYGFILTREEQGEQWGSMVTEQRFECTRLLA